MKTVTLHSNDQQKLDLLVQVAKEIGVEVVVHYDNSSDTNTDTANEPNERYNTKVLIEVTDKHSEIGDDYCLPGPPISEEEMDAWLAKDDDEECVEFTAEEFISYIQKKRDDKRK